MNWPIPINESAQDRRGAALLPENPPIFPRPRARGRLIALAPLSNNLPVGRIADTLALALQEATQQPVLLVELTLGEGRLRLNDLSIKDLTYAESTLPYPQSTDAGFDRLVVQVAGLPAEAPLLAALLARYTRVYRHVLMLMGAELPIHPAIEGLVMADNAYLVFEQTSEEMLNYNLLLREVRAHNRGDESRIRPVCFVPEDRRVAADSPVARSPHPPLYLHARADCFDRQIRSWAREICRRRVGLVLSAGAAKGLAHIGVIQVLEENGIEVDAIAGCSMGAYIGAVWASGHDGPQLEKFACELEGRFGFLKLVDPALPPRRGFLLGWSVRRRLRRTIGEVNFSDLVRPLRVVATNLATLERTVFTSGSVVDAVRASTAIPGVWVPVRIGGETFVDGGIVDPVPVSVLQQQGIDRIIAVNVIPTPAFLKCVREREREQEAVHGPQFSPLEFLHRHFNYFAPGNVLDIMLQSMNAAQMLLAEESSKHADIVLRPLSCDSHWFEFNRPRKYIELGRTAALEHLDEIKALIARKESNEHHRTHDILAAVA